MVDLGFRRSRRETDAPILHGWGNIPGAIRGGVFATYRIGIVAAHTSVTDGTHDQCVIATFGFGANFHPIPRLTLSFGPEVKWTGAQYAMTLLRCRFSAVRYCGVSSLPSRHRNEHAGWRGGRWLRVHQASVLRGKCALWAPTGELLRTAP